MKQLTSEEVRQVQMIVLQEFHNFCTTHNLKYSLCAGTLLGAVRHKGYIPWDDDIDVMMPRREYIKLLKLYKSNQYTLYTYDTHREYMLPYAKLCDNRTILLEGVIYEGNFGVDIDIFPLDFFPNGIEESVKWTNRLKFLKDIRAVKNITISCNRSFIKNAILFVCRCLTFPIPMKWIVRRIDRVAQKYSEHEGGYVGNMTNGYNMKERTPMAKGLIDIEFEGKLFKAVNNYDVYLSSLFGNYMQLPPVEKRISTHTARAYWK